MSKKYGIGFLLLIGLVFGYFIVKQSKSPAAPTPPSSGTKTQKETTQTVPERTVTINATNFSYDLKEIRIKRGEKIVLEVKNTEGFHDLVIDELGVKTKQLKEGESQAIIVSSDVAGKYEYYCSVGAHRMMGMKGTLIIE
ncbi:MAG: cupredoxin domain-containing protein [Candidatus Pacebacteria bacterium]|nr:cupredoxin domain-containing protein [Candidatus Paceibacterota bacterium]